MAVILAYGSPSLGHLFPIAALLLELAGLGNQFQLRTMSDEVPSMRNFWFLAEPVDPRIEAIAGQDWLAGNALGVLESSIGVLCRRAVLEVDDLNAAIGRVEPDLVIVDANCWGAMSMADAGSIPWAVFSPFTPYLRSRGVPPFGPNLRPLPGLLGDIRDASMRPFVTHLFDRRMLPRINAIRTELGVPRVGSVDEFFRRALLLLAVGGEPFEYPHPGWGDAVHLIGACVFEPTPATAPEWLIAIERPIVLVNTSSIKQADSILGRTALEVLADKPVHVVATFPAGVPANLPRPANATVCQFVPHGAALERAVCAITHGGMGTTVKALDRGVPVCVVPFARGQSRDIVKRSGACVWTRTRPTRQWPRGRQVSARRRYRQTDRARRQRSGR